MYICMLLCPTGEDLHGQIAFCATLSLIGINLFQIQIQICYLLSEAQSRCRSLAVHNIWQWGNNYVSVVPMVYWCIWSRPPITCCIWSDGWCVGAPERIPAWTWTKVAIVSTSVCETPTDIYAHVHTVCTGGTLCVVCVVPDVQVCRSFQIDGCCLLHVRMSCCSCTTHLWPSCCVMIQCVCYSEGYAWMWAYPVYSRNSRKW